MLVRKLALNMHIAYIPFGFDESITSDEIVLVAKKIKKHLPNNTIMLKLDLPYGVNIKDRRFKLNRNCIQPKSSVLIALPDEFELKKRVKRINKDSKIIVKNVEKTKENIALWYELYSSTASRKGFFTRSFNYFNSLLNIPDNNIILYFAFNDDLLVGSIINIRSKDEEIYLFGASIEGSNSGYALQQYAINKAIEDGLKHYDLYGIGDEEHPELKTLNLFKQSFGGQIVTRIGTLDYYYNFIGKLFNFADYLRYLFYKHKL